MVPPKERTAVVSTEDDNPPCDTEQQPAPPGGSWGDASCIADNVYADSGDDSFFSSVARIGSQNPTLDATLENGTGQGGENSRVYCLINERDAVAYEISLQEGHRVTFGPMAPGGKFPSCFRIYDKPKGGECILAITGITSYYRKDLHIKKGK